jgi:hypothetical protein
MDVSHDCLVSHAPERMRVAPDRSRAGEFGGGAVGNGVAPVRRNLRQRAHNEQPLCRTRVRQNEFRRLQDFAAEGDEIQIKRPWPIGDAALTPELAFNLL